MIAKSRTNSRKRTAPSSMMGEPQLIVAPDGTELVVIPKSLWLETLARAQQVGEQPKEDTLTIPAEVDRYIRLGLMPVAAWRRYAGLSQTALAERVGVTQAAIARIEAGAPGTGRDDTLHKISMVLGAPITQINPPPRTPMDKLRKAAAYSANRHGRITRAASPRG